MSTKIEWADETWNPITGCTKISSGCKNCYASRMANRLAGRFGYPKDDPFRVTLHPDKLELPYHWLKPRRIFVCSMGDLFHEDVPDSWISDVHWKVQVAKCHTFLVLTKRPERMRDYYSRYVSANELLNLWIGVSVENQEMADKRIPILLQIPAAVRFVSVEPMLEETYIREYLLGEWKCKCGVWTSEIRAYCSAGCVGQRKVSNRRVNWVIAGGETGSGWRDCDVGHFRDLRVQCAVAGVPFFMKKMPGGGKPPKDLMIRQFPTAHE